MLSDSVRTPESISVVAPFYNEAASAKAFHDALAQTMQRIGKPYELIYVDDGSADMTLPALREIAIQDEHVKVVSLSRNFGHQAALTAGLDLATSSVVISMDSDLQHPPEVIPELLAAYEKGADIVYAIRRDADNLPLFKRLPSTLFYSLMRSIANIEVLPGAADFRLMSSGAVRALGQMREQHRYLRGMVPWLGFNTTIVEYDQPERFAGKPVYTFRKSLNLALNGLFSFSTVPLQMITWMGIIMTMLAMIYLVYILFTYATGQTIVGWASVIVVVLVIGGVQLISVGILAQYIGRIFEESKQRPLYIVREIHSKVGLKETHGENNEQ